jgi:uncharacterized protein (TIGR02246 family)
MKGSILLRTGAVLLLATAAFTAGAQDDEVQRLAERWTEAYNGHNRAALGRLYTPNAHLMMHGSPTIAGRDAIEAFWSEDFLEGDPLTVLTVTHSLTGTDMILVHGNYQVINRENGIVLGLGRFAHIWNLQADGEWQLDRDFWNEPFEPYRQ